MRRQLISAPTWRLVIAAPADIRRAQIDRAELDRSGERGNWLERAHGRRAHFRPARSPRRQVVGWLTSLFKLQKRLHALCGGEREREAARVGGAEAKGGASLRGHRNNVPDYLVLIIGQDGNGGQTNVRAGGMGAGGVTCYCSIDRLLSRRRKLAIVGFVRASLGPSALYTGIHIHTHTYTHIHRDRQQQNTSNPAAAGAFSSECRRKQVALLRSINLARQRKARANPDLARKISPACQQA